MSRALALGALLALATPAAAHETLHQVERGRAVAVRATYADGAPLAYVPFEVYAPEDPKVPWLKGRTDRDGWVAFVPAAPGRWRVRVIEEAGHGLDLEVDAAAPAAGEGGRPPGGIGFVLRPLLGLAVIVAIFAGLWLARRRKGSTP